MEEKLDEIMGGLLVGGLGLLVFLTLPIWILLFIFYKFIKYLIKGRNN